MHYFRVKNWEEFQQYKDGRPMHWFKLHTSLLDDYDFDNLPEISQAHLIKIWALAAKTDNRIPGDAVFLARKIGAKQEIDINLLVTAGFLLPYEIVRNCTDTGDAPYLEKRREEEIREEKKEKKSARGARLPDQWQPSQGLLSWAMTERTDLDMQKVIDSFTDYWRAKPGQAGCKLDWDATFRNWVRSQKGTPNGKARENPADRRAREADDYRRRILAGQT